MSTGHKHDLEVWDKVVAQEGAQGMPMIPPAFDPAFVPEMQKHLAETGGLYQHRAMGKALDGLNEAVEEIHQRLADIRRPYEQGWADARAAYDMAAELEVDANRKKSVNPIDYRDDNAELDPARASVTLPLCYEAERLMEANLYRRVRGAGAEYCEILSEEPGDIPGAEIAQEIINYQQHYEIRSPELFSDWLNGALVEGSGVAFQYWDQLRRRRSVVIADRQDVWWDTAPTIEQSRTLIWRRSITRGEAKRLRDAGAFWFTDKDLDSLQSGRAGSKFTSMNSAMTDTNNRKQFEFEVLAKKTTKASSDHELMYLDIIMDTEPWRWIYRLNESIIVAVQRPMIMPGPHGDARHPCTVYSPIRIKGRIDGDSIMVRMIKIQDLANSMLALLTEHSKRLALGIPVTDDSTLDNKDLIVGRFNVICGDPTRTTLMQFPDATQSLQSQIEYLRNRAEDPISGVTSTLRGQAPYSGMTATATRDLLNESANRLSQMEDLAVAAMQDFYTVALLINQQYMAQSDAVRVVGEPGAAIIWRPGMGGQPRPMTGQDLYGVVGKDMVPSGYPGSGSKYMLTADTLNEAAVIAQAGGDPKPLMHRYLKTKYGRLVDINSVFPSTDGVGHDPIQENMLIAQGRPVQRDPNDMDQYHVQIHQMLLGDVQFAQNAMTNPQLAILFQTHMQHHMANIQQQMAVATAMGSAASGGMGKGSGASGARSPSGPDPKKDSEREAQVNPNGSAEGKS